MTAKSVLKRQNELLKNLAKFFDYTTNFQASLKEFHEEFREVSKSYDLLDVEKAFEAGLSPHDERWLPNADYLHDIESLVNRGYLGVVYDRHPKEDGYMVSYNFLTEKGLDHVNYLGKNFVSKSWDKQPATTLNLIFVILNIIITAINSAIAIKGQG